MDISSTICALGDVSSAISSRWRASAPDPQPGLALRPEHQCRRRRRIDHGEPLQATPVPAPVVAQVGRQQCRPQQCLGDAQRAAGLAGHPRLAVPAGRIGLRHDAPLRYFEHPVADRDRPLAREDEAGQPVDEHWIGLPDNVIESAETVDAGRRDAHPLVCGGRGIVDDDPDDIGIARRLVEREPQVAPGRGTASVER